MRTYIVVFNIDDDTYRIAFRDDTDAPFMHFIDHRYPPFTDRDTIMGVCAAANRVG